MTGFSITVPVAFLRDVLPSITSFDEMVTSLTVFRLVGESGSEETPIAEQSIMADDALRRTLQAQGGVMGLDRRIFDALELAVGRDTFVRFVTVADGQERAWYYTATPVTRALVKAMQRNAIPAPRIVWEGDVAPAVAVDPPNVFRLYEQNIAPISPMVADQLSRAASEYPVDWIEEAIGEAVSYNKRNWRYIQRILENWRQSGRSTID